ncbi:hypothetical protein II5_05892 [Bacillus cereus MSX-A1]|nr:hypothetical protein II5_05892 [Bacillus cereus MSX-A1]
MNKNLKFTQLILGISAMALSFGSIQTQVSAEETAPYNALQIKPIGTETLKDDIAHATKAEETLTFEERLKVGDFSQRPTPVMKRDERQLNKNYTLAELNKMPDSELMNTLSRISWNQITDLFQITPDTKAFYQNKERMNVIIDEFGKRGEVFTKEDSKGIETFVEILRSAFYVGYYNNELTYLKD